VVGSARSIQALPVIFPSRVRRHSSPTSRSCNRWHLVPSLVPIRNTQFSTRPFICRESYARQHYVCKDFPPLRVFQISNFSFLVFSPQSAIRDPQFFVLHPFFPLLIGKSFS